MAASPSMTVMIAAVRKAAASNEIVQVGPQQDDTGPITFALVTPLAYGETGRRPVLTLHLDAAALTSPALRHAGRMQHGLQAVLLVPEGLAATEADSLPVGAEAFEDLSERLLAGLAAAVQGADKAHAVRLAEGKEVLAALDSDPVQRAMAADPELKAQAELGATRLQQDPAAAQAAQETFKRLQGQAAAELALLAKLLG